jgi:Zn-dependent protease
MALVALAGPLSNFLLALIGYGIFSLLNISSGLFGSILVLFVKINLGLMLFNLLPIPPLDGSKIIYPIAPEFVQDIIEKLEKNSWLVFVIILLFTAQISAVIGMVQSWILSFFVAIF